MVMFVLHEVEVDSGPVLPCQSSDCGVGLRRAKFAEDHQGSCVDVADCDEQEQVTEGRHLEMFDF